MKECKLGLVLGFFPKNHVSRTDEIQAHSRNRSTRHTFQRSQWTIPFVDDGCVDGIVECSSSAHREQVSNELSRHAVALIAAYLRDGAEGNEPVEEPCDCRCAHKGQDACTVPTNESCKSVKKRDIYHESNSSRDAKKQKLISVVHRIRT